MRIIELVEKIIIRDEAISDVDGQAGEVIILLNPSPQETLGLLRRSAEHALRGFVAESDGSVYCWDAYLCDHAGAGQLLTRHGYPSPWPRFSMDLDEFQAGVVRNYIDSGISADGWAAIPDRHLRLMLGQPVRFVPS